MSEVILLVDYDNLRDGEFRGGSGRGASPNLRHHQDFVSNIVEKLLNFRLNLPDKLLEFRIRLYGGWSTDMQGTRSEMGELAFRAVLNYGKSRREKNTRIFLELAESPLAAPREMLFNTMRTSSWTGGSLEFEPSLSCPDHPNSCPEVIHMLAWAKGRCPRHPNCKVSSRDWIFVKSQKLVDAMMISDFLHAHFSQNSEAILVSRDDDFVPGVLTVAAQRGSATLVRFGLRTEGRYDAILKKAGVTIFDYPSIGS